MKCIIEEKPEFYEIKTFRELDKDDIFYIVIMKGNSLVKEVKDGPLVISTQTHENEKKEKDSTLCFNLETNGIRFVKPDDEIFVGDIYKQKDRIKLVRKDLAK